VGAVPSRNCGLPSAYTTQECLRQSLALQEPVEELKPGLRQEWRLHWSEHGEALVAVRMNLEGWKDFNCKNNAILFLPADKNSRGYHSCQNVHSGC
jgi:hypothetical protein